MLVELKQILQQRGHMSVVDMAQCLQIDQVQCRMLLMHWQKHGQVTRLDAVPGCGDCRTCPLRTLHEYYAWTG